MEYLPPLTFLGIYPIYCSFPKGTSCLKLLGSAKSMPCPERMWTPSHPRLSESDLQQLPKLIRPPPVLTCALAREKISQRPLLALGRRLKPSRILITQCCWERSRETQAQTPLPWGKDSLNSDITPAPSLTRTKGFGTTECHVPVQRFAQEGSLRLWKRQ